MRQLSGGGVALHPAHMSPHQVMLRRHSSTAADHAKEVAFPKPFESRTVSAGSAKPRAPCRPPLPARFLKPPEVYVTSSSRVCLAQKLDGLVETRVQKPVASRQLPGGPRGVQLRDVSYDNADETQAVSIWLEGWSSLQFPHTSNACGCYRVTLI